MPTTVRISILHGPKGPMYPSPDGRLTGDLSVSARFDFAADHLLAFRRPLPPRLEPIRTATGDAVAVAADWAVDAFIAPLVTAGLYARVWCAACDADYRPAEVTTRAYRNEHGSWGVNAGVQFYCPRGHALYDRKDEQTA